jgi:hypothetical protein
LIESEAGATRSGDELIGRRRSQHDDIFYLSRLALSPLDADLPAREAFSAEAG